MLARLTVATSVVEPRGTALSAPRAACLPERTTGPSGAARKACFSARCWNAGSCHGLQRRSLGGHAHDCRGELVVRGVERPHRRRQAEDPAQLAALAGDRRGDAAEVLVELLAVDG